MRTPEILESVKKFHAAFGHPVLGTPSLIPRERAQLRIGLIAEELDELEHAVDNDDLVEVADALADLAYVVAGAVLEFGLGDRFAAIFDEVQRSNMSKACATREEADVTVAVYRLSRGVDVYSEERNGTILVKRVSDGKMLKSINYSPANIRDILK